MWGEGGEIYRDRHGTFGILPDQEPVLTQHASKEVLQKQRRCTRKEDPGDQGRSNYVKCVESTI